MATPSEKGTAKSPRRKSGAPRPDEMSPEVFEFLTAIDDYKRANLRSFLGLTEVFEVLDKLRYRAGDPPMPQDAAIEALSDAIDAYKKEQGRLFPSWSEIFLVARELGWAR